MGMIFFNVTGKLVDDIGFKNKMEMTDCVRGRGWRCLYDRKRIEMIVFVRGEPMGIIACVAKRRWDFSLKN